MQTLASRGLRCTTAGLRAVVAARGTASQRAFELKAHLADPAALPFPPPEGQGALQGAAADFEGQALAVPLRMLPEGGAGAGVASQALESGAIGGIEKGLTAVFHPPPQRQGSRGSSALTPVASGGQPAKPPTPPLPPAKAPLSVKFTQDQWQTVLAGALAITAHPLAVLEAAQTELHGGSEASADARLKSTGATVAATAPWAEAQYCQGIAALAVHAGQLAVEAAVAPATTAASTGQGSGVPPPSSRPTSSTAHALRLGMLPGHVPSCHRGPASQGPFPSDAEVWAPGLPVAQSPPGLAALWGGATTAPETALATDLRIVLAAAGAAGDVKRAVQVGDVLGALPGGLTSGDFEGLLHACERARQPNRADALLAAMKTATGGITPTAVASTVGAHLDSGNAYAGMAHLMTASTAGMALSERVYWAAMDACGDADAVGAVLDALQAGVEAGHARLAAVLGRLHPRGNINVTGLGGGAARCVVWDTLRALRRAAELGQDVPSQLRLHHRPRQAEPLEGTLLSLDPPLHSIQRVSASGLPYRWVPRESWLAWLTTPAAMDEEGEAWEEAAHLPAYVAQGAPAERGSPTVIPGLPSSVLDQPASAPSPPVAAPGGQREGGFQRWRRAEAKSVARRRARLQADAAVARADVARRRAAAQSAKAAARSQAALRQSVGHKDAALLEELLTGQGLPVATARAAKARHGFAPHMDRRGGGQ